jgi:hypothetical protein
MLSGGNQQRNRGHISTISYDDGGAVVIIGPKEWKGCVRIRHKRSNNINNMGMFGTYNLDTLFIFLIFVIPGMKIVKAFVCRIKRRKGDLLLKGKRENGFLASQGVLKRRTEKDSSNGFMKILLY